MGPKLRKLKGVCALAMMVSGCAMAPADAPGFAEADIAEPNEQSSVLVVYRKYAPPMAYSVTTKLNGKVLADLPNGAFTWTRMDPGEQTLTIEWPFLAMQPDRKQVLKVAPGKYYFVEFRGNFNVLLGVGYSVQNLGEINRDRAVAELRECCRYVRSHP
jgi:hypothetical protein